MIAVALLPIFVYGSLQSLDLLMVFILPNVGTDPDC